MDNLYNKIEKSIAFIQRGERLALSLNPSNGYFVGFSGGKDSQVLLDLVQRAGVKYRAVYSVTTIDPPDNVYFIRHHYPEVIFEHHHPNFYHLVAKKGLPTICRRWCCDEFKEGGGAGHVVLTGVRREESKKREKYHPVKVISERKEHQNRTEPYTIEGIETAHHQCIKGKDKIMLYPLLDWTSTDIWVYIARNHIPVNPCYETSGRVGCMFCPFASRQQIEHYEETQPKAFSLLLDNLTKYLTNSLGGRDRYHLADVKEYWEWWKSGKKLQEFTANKSQFQIDFKE